MNNHLKKKLKKSETRENKIINEIVNSLVDNVEQKTEQNQISAIVSKQDRKPWIEKYRPIKIDDIVASEIIKLKIRNYVAKKTIPHLILTGEPGIGKTTTMVCLAREIYGKYYKNAILELNASDDRGVKAVNDITANACKRSLNFKKEDEGKYGKKIIIMFDEADNITAKAQILISNLMEKFRKKVSFIFTCNNPAGIIGTIQSKCDILKYNRIPDALIYGRLEYICQQEHVPYNTDGLNTIIMVSQGDLRQAINNLQAVHKSYRKISTDNVLKICDRPHPEVILDLLKACENHDFNSAQKISREMIQDNGYSIHDVIDGIITVIKQPNIPIQEENKMKFMKAISVLCYVINSVESPLQLDACIARMCL